MANDAVLAAPIAGVTVFRDGARITRSGEAAIPAGLSPVVLAHLPVSADPESVRVGVRGNDVALLEVEANLRHGVDPVRAETARLREEAERCRDAVKALEDQDTSEQARLGFSYLRPIQVAFESPKFMLPIRLGTVNANGPQELFIYALTRKGRVETTNYRTVKLPSDMDIPLFVKDEFAGFYRALFAEQVKKEHMHSVFLEYAWDMNWCDPCAAQPLSRDELRKLGVFWIASNANGSGGPQDVFLTRLHLRYDAAHFPEDLVFQETADRANFQARYVLRHAFAGQINCASDSYREQLTARHEQEAKNLVSLTGWRMADVRQKMNLVSENIDDRKWYERIWEK